MADVRNAISLATNESHISQLDMSAGRVVLTMPQGNLRTDTTWVALLDHATVRCASGMRDLSLTVHSASRLAFELPCTIPGLLEDGTYGTLLAVATTPHNRSSLALVVSGGHFNGVPLTGQLVVDWPGVASSGWEVERGRLSGRGHMRACDHELCPQLSGTVILEREAAFGEVTRKMNVERVGLNLASIQVPNQLPVEGILIFERDGSIESFVGTATLFGISATTTLRLGRSGPQPHSEGCGLGDPGRDALCVCVRDTIREYALPALEPKEPFLLHWLTACG